MVNLSITDRTRADAYLTLVPNPTFLGLSDDALSRDWVMLGQKIKIFSPVANPAVSSETFRAGATRAIEIVEASPTADYLSLTPTPVAIVNLTVLDEAMSDDLWVIGYIGAIDITDVGISAEVVNFNPPIPFIREPQGVEVRGTVNLARNPNLESDIMGLADWSSGAGITLTRTSLATPWTGSMTGRAAIQPGSLARPEVVVISQQGLGVKSFGKRWVGSVQLRGDSDEVTLSLVVRYMDGSTDESVPVVTGAGEVPPLTDEWIRYMTEPIGQNGTKILDRLELHVAMKNDPFIERIVRLDAVQFEDALTGSMTPYADGDQGPYHWWVGAPSFSMSVRDTA